MKGTLKVKDAYIYANCLEIEVLKIQQSGQRVNARCDGNSPCPVSPSKTGRPRSGLKVVRAFTNPQFPTFNAESKFAKKKNFCEKLSKFSGKKVPGNSFGL